MMNELQSSTKYLKARSEVTENPYKNILMLLCIQYGIMIPLQRPRVMPLYTQRGTLYNSTMSNRIM